MPTIIPAVGKDPSVRIITLDFETYYDNECSLKKLTYEEYIHHPRFYVMMVSIKINNGETYCVVGEDNCRTELGRLQLGVPNTFVVGQNNRFDASILAWRFGIIPANICCTLLMARVMGLARLQSSSLDNMSSYFRTKGYNIPKKGDAVHNMVGKHLTDISEEQRHGYVEYCKTDTDICYLIFSLFLQLGFPKAHLRYIDLTIKMYVRPQFLLDHKKLDDYVTNLKTVREASLQSLANMVGAPNTIALLSMLRSKNKFQPLFKEVTGRDLPLKVSEKKTETARKQLDYIKSRLTNLRAEYNRDPDNASLATKNEIQELNTSWHKIMDNPLLVKNEETNEVVVYDYACSKTDLDFTALLECGDPLVELLVETKLGVTSSIAITRATRFRDIAARMGHLPFPLEYAAASTGRYGGADKINCQNLPARGDTTLRECMLAPTGYTVVVADSSQVEARVLAYIAGEQWLIDVFATGGDPYSAMASDIYYETYETILTHAKARTTPGTPEYELHKKYNLYRQVGKVSILGQGYQMSANKFADYLKLMKITLKPDRDGLIQFIQDQIICNHLNPNDKDKLRELGQSYIEAYHLSEAQRINKIYRDKNPAIKALWYKCGDILRALVRGESGYFGGPNGDLLFYDGLHDVCGTPTPGVRLPNGYWILYPNLKVEKDEKTGYDQFSYKLYNGYKYEWVYIYGGKMVENITQGLAFAVMLFQGELINRKYPIALNVHDEWGIVVKSELTDDAIKTMTDAMTTVPDYLVGCPLTCEVETGGSYGTCQ